MWSSAQLEIELHRFLGALGRLSAGDLDVTPDDIIDRFDIQWSRTALFETGEVADRLNHHDAEERAIEALFATMQAQEDAVMSLEDGDAQAVLSLLMAFKPHGAALRQLSIRVIGGGRDQGRGVTRCDPVKSVHGRHTQRRGYPDCDFADRRDIF